jgi:pimeloyl-ACP methyl ester carboxylesterase
MAAPPVVLVHGWGGSFAQTWQRPGIVDLVTDTGRQVVGVDLLGHGDAPKPHETEAYADLTVRVSEAITAVTGSDGPVDAVGFSLGAITLLQMAVARPQRFRRLVVAGVGRTLFEVDEERHRMILDALEGRGGDDNVGRLFTQYAAQPGNDREALTAIMRRPRQAPMRPEDLAVVTCPTLVVIGDRDFAGPGEPLAEALPDARLVTLRNCDHFATTEHFGFIDAMLDFLDG